MTVQLSEAELRLLRAVQQTNDSGDFHRAGKLGIAESLCKRGFLVRNHDSSLYLSENGRAALAECNKTAKANESKARHKPRSSAGTSSQNATKGPKCSEVRR